VTVVLIIVNFFFSNMSRLIIDNLWEDKLIG